VCGMRGAKSPKKAIILLGPLTSSGHVTGKWTGEYYFAVGDGTQFFSANGNGAGRSEVEGVEEEVCAQGMTKSRKGAYSVQKCTVRCEKEGGRMWGGKDQLEQQEQS
jgi:hypothetical protein